MSRYAPKDTRDIARMVDEEVLGIVTTHDAYGFIATPLPLLAIRDEAGGVAELFGHFALSNPHVERVRHTPAAQITVMGPHGYIAPAMVSRRGWAPTWNFRFVQFQVEIALATDENDRAIRALVARMEGDGDGAWSVDEVGGRYAGMVANVVAFRARVVDAAARFKLGQDEDPATFDEIVAALGSDRLADAMIDQRQP